MRLARPISLAPALLGLSAALSIAPPSLASASSKIVTRAGAQRVVAIPATGGAPRTLFRIRHGFVAAIAVSRDGGRIAVAAHSTLRRDPHSISIDRIWIMRGDGGGARVARAFRDGRGTEQGGVDSVALSPDGDRVLVGRTLRGKAGIAPIVMRADGSDAHPIPLRGYRFGIGPGYNSGNPEFTPDGRRVIGQFYSVGSSRSRTHGIGTVALDGGAIHFLRLGPRGSSRGSGFAPTISDDGRFIAFVLSRQRGFSGRIMVMRRDGTHLHALVRTTIPQWRIGNPDFSPSGGSIAFTGELGRPLIRVGIDPVAVFTIRRNGTDLRRLHRERNPHWYSSNAVWST